MQPMNRPPGPPYDPRSMGQSPGIPPPMRPHEGFRPHQVAPGMPVSSNFNRPPSGPPIQKMADMNLGHPMAPVQTRPSTTQLNPAISNGVPNTRSGDMPSICEPKFSATQQQDNPNSFHNQSEYSSLSEQHFPMEQTVNSVRSAMSHPENSSLTKNFPADRGIPPQSMIGGQSSKPEMNLQNVSDLTQPVTNFMPFQSPNTSLPSTVGTSPSVGSIMSPHISGPQLQSQPGLSMPHSVSPAIPQPTRPTIPTSVPEMPNTPGQSMHPIHEPNMPQPGMPQRHGPGIPQPTTPGLPQSHEPRLSQFSAMPRLPGTPQNVGSPSEPYRQMQPNVSEPSIPMQSSLSPYPTAPGIPPQNYGPGMQPQKLGPEMPPQMSGPGMPPYRAGLGMSPQMSGPRMPPQRPIMGMPGQNFQSPTMNTQTRSPLVPPMPPGASPDSSGRFGMPPVGNRGTPGSMGPTPGYQPPVEQNYLSGQPSVPQISGVSPTMAPMPGMQPRMPPPPGPMSSPGMLPPPQSGAVPPPSMGQQQYAAQQGGMQNRYPGTNAQAPSMGGYPQGQGRKLNPDDMPSPLQVIEEDMQTKSGEFITNIKGTLPPMVTTDFYVTDGGNASPRFIRSTMYSIPGTPDLMKHAAVPFGLVISPMANLHPNEAPLYIGTSLTNGPVRCNRCKAYMSTLMTFMDGGRRFQCLLCKQTNEVPPDYYCHMDSQGARADKFQRPELCLGAFEYIATPEYCRDKLLPKEPAFIFVLEMTQMMLQRGVISLLCKNMKDILQNLPVDHIPGQEEEVKSKVHVGFITYDSSVHFYKLSGLSPEMCVVCDKEGMFVPVPDGILCEPEQVADNIEKLMESIPQNFQTARETSGNLYAAINAGMAALKASGRAGKLFVFHSSLPQGEGVGKVKNRDDRKVLGTDKEKSVLTPQNSHYGSLAQDLVSAGCAVDLYLFNEAYIDLATLGQVCRLTGGQCFKYTYFTHNKDGPRLLDDLKINVGRNIAFEAVMRVRTSTGVRSVEFYGNFYMSNTHDIELAAIDSSKAVAIEIKHDDKITEEDGVYLQTALLYTSCGGQRRLRILNLSLNVCTQMADLFRSCDNDTLMNFLAKESMFKFLQSSAKQVKDNLIAKTAQILSCYRKSCASPSSVGQLILPELLKLLPLYINCLSRSDALSGGQDLTCDDRSWHINQLCTMDVAASAAYLYPRLIPLSDVDPQDTTVPPPLRTSYDKLRADGVFLLENGLFMFIWVGSGTSTTWMTDVFGVAAPHHLDPVISELPDIDNPTANRVRGIIDSIRKERGLHLRLFVVPQQGKHELIMRNYLVEDKGTMGAPSYVEFLCHIHKEVRAILS